MTRPSRTIALSALALLCVASGPCDDGSSNTKRHFETPAGIAIGPFGAAQPPHQHAFVADPGNFALRRIDVESRKVVEPRFPVGRPLSAVVAHTGVASTVDRVWGIDRALGEVIAIDPALALVPTVSTVAWTDAGATSQVAIDEVKVVEGRTATETWTVTYREGLERWEVRGSGSGIQKKFAQTGDGYSSDNKEVNFTIRRTGDAVPTEGDRFEFTTDNGIVASAVAGSAMAINLVAVSNDIALVSTDAPAVIAFSQETGIAAATFSLPAGAIPAGMETQADGAAVWIADLGNPLLHELTTTGLPGTWTLTSHPAPVPMRDVAISGDGLRVFGMAADADDVFAFDAATFAPVDFSAQNPGFDPLEFPSAIRGIGGARQPHVMRGSGVPSYPVLVTSHAGNLYVLNGATGCIDFNDARGARFVGARFRDSVRPSGPKFDLNEFETSRCGGVVRTETWTLTFNSLLGAWEVEGSLSGKQVGLMTEGTVYTTDLGEITMRIEPSADLPTDDADTFFISVADGVVPLSIGLVPERPVVFTLIRDGEPFEYALVSNASSDTVTQIDIGRRRITAQYR